MKILGSLIFLTLPLMAQVSGTSWRVIDLAPDSVSICLSINNPTDNVTSGRIARSETCSGFTPDVNLSYVTCATTSYDNCCIVDNNLKPGTTYCVHPELYNGTVGSAYDDTDSQTALAEGASAICGSYNGAGCAITTDGGGNDLLEITTPSAASYTAPVHPTPASSPQHYTITGMTTTLTVNGSNEVQNLQATIDAVLTAMEADSDGEVYGIRFPAGSTASPEFESLTQFEFKNFVDTVPNSRLVVFCDAVDSDGDLPLGGIMEDIDKPCASIRFSAEEAPTQSLVTFESGASRIYFRQIKWDVPLFSTVSVPTIAVNSATVGSKTTLSLASSVAPLGDQFGVRVPSLNNIFYRVGFNQQERGDGESVWSGTTTISPTLPASLPETGSSGTGIVYWPSSHAFEGSDANTLTFASDHQGADGPAETISSITSGVVTLSGAHSYDLPATNYEPTFLIEGSTGTGCNGLFTAASANAGAGTINLDSGPASCTGGTIRQVFTVLLHHINGLAQDHMSCLVSFTSTTTVDVLSCWYNSAEITPDWTSVLGYLILDPVQLPPFLDLRNASEIVVESGAFDAGGLPWRQTNQILLGEMDDFILAGSRHLAEYWKAINPLTGTAHSDSRHQPDTLGAILNGLSNTNMQILNISADMASFFVFMPNTSTGCPQDHIYQAVRLNTPDSMAHGETGVARPRRQDIEYKTCIQGLWMSGIHRANQIMASTPTGAFLSAQTNVAFGDNSSFIKSVTDIHFENSYLEGNFGFAIGSRVHEYGGAATYLRGINARMRFNNWIWKDKGRRGGPTGDFMSVAGPSSNVQGLFMRTGNGGISQLMLEDFTILPSESDDQFTAFMELNAPQASLTVRNGIIMDSGPLGANFARMRTFGGSSAWADIEDKMFRDNETTLSANSAVSNILVVPCTDDAEDHDFVTANDPANVNNIWNVTGWNDSGRVSLYSTSSSEGCGDRMDGVFTGTDYTPNGTYNDKGADPEAILDAQGRIRDVVAKVTTTEMYLTYKAPTTTRECTAAAVAGSNVNYFTASTVYGATDVPGGSQDRTLVLTGLTPGTLYSVRLSCELGATLRGSVTTLSN